MSKWLMVTLGCARRSCAAVQWLHSAVQQYSGYTQLCTAQRCSSTVVKLGCARRSGAAVQWLHSAVHGALTFVVEREMCCHLSACVRVYAAHFKHQF